MERRKISPVAVMLRIQNLTGRSRVCECQFLNDDKEVKRRRLRANFECLLTL
jgi:hypothetical protein